jgi:hypothetical protein
MLCCTGDDVWDFNQAVLPVAQNIAKPCLRAQLSLTGFRLLDFMRIGSVGQHWP